MSVEDWENEGGNAPPHNPKDKEDKRTDQEQEETHRGEILEGWDEWNEEDIENNKD